MANIYRFIHSLKIRRKWLAVRNNVQIAWVTHGNERRPLFDIQTLETVCAINRDRDRGRKTILGLLCASKLPHLAGYVIKLKQPKWMRTKHSARILHVPTVESKMLGASLLRALEQTRKQGQTWGTRSSGSSGGAGTKQWQYNGRRFVFQL